MKKYKVHLEITQVHYLSRILNAENEQAAIEQAIIDYQDGEDFEDEQMFNDIHVTPNFEDITVEEV